MFTVFFPVVFGQTMTIEENNKKGTELLNSGKYEEAISYFDKVLEIEPANIDAMNNKGASLISLERYEESLSTFDKILEIYPDDDIAWNNRNAVLSKIKLEPILDSKYLVHVQTQLRNSHGNLIGIIESDASKFLSHVFVDEFLDSNQIKETVTIDDKAYEKWKFIFTQEYMKETYGSRNNFFVGTDENTVGIFDGNSHAFVVEIGDTITVSWTVLRLID